MSTIYPNTQVPLGALPNSTYSHVGLGGYNAVIPELTEEEMTLQKTNEELKVKVAALEEELKGLKKILDD